MSIDDEEPAVLERDLLMGELATLNQSRYELQAKEFIAKGSLLIKGSNFILNYRFENPFCMVYVSYDGGGNFKRLGGRRLNSQDGHDEFRIFWEFADKEARVLLHR